MQWKAIDTNSDYEVSDEGLIRKNNKIVPVYEDKDGYLMLPLKVNEKKTTRRVHRLVLHAFNPCENESELEVHHIDENKHNNCLSSLKWVTHEENINYINPKKLQSPNQFIARSVAQYSVNGALIAIFPSVHNAGKITGCNYRHISEVCNGRRKTCGGFIWKYFEGSTTNYGNKCCKTGDLAKASEDIV